MLRVGVRELRAHTSKILRRVRENRDTVEVLYRGRAVARLVPLAESRARTSEEEFWKQWDALSEEIDSSWPVGETAEGAIRDDRRSL